MNQGIFYSIITPCYNSARYIKETYASLSAQTYSNWEWVVVDDCSTDGSLEILQKITKQDSRIKLFKTQENSGAAVARNIAIENSGGDFLAFLDIDDLWDENKLQVYYEQIKENNIAFAYSNYLKIGPTGKKGRSVIQTPEHIKFKDLLKTCSICTSTAVIKKIAVGSTRMRSELRRGQDYIFWLDVLRKEVLAHRISEETLTYYRVGNKTSLSSNKLKKAIGQWKMYRHYLGLSLIKSVYYFIFYVAAGFLKQRQF